MSNHDEASSNGGVDMQHSCPNTSQVGNIIDLANRTGIETDSAQTSSEAIPNHGLNTSGGFEDLIMGSSVRGRPVPSRATRSGLFSEEMLLNTLRSFILERGGVLGEGWHVEFVESPYGYDPNSFPLYCAPDGKKFESMYDVAYFLGISPGFTPVEVDERSDGSGSVQRPLPSRRGRKHLARISATSRSAENQDSARLNCREELCSDTEFILQYNDIKSAPRGAKSYMEENGVDKSRKLSIELPIQYEDFFVLCLGKIDVRGAYHDSNQIWPIGYKSNWHDKVTGSLFYCEVSDGGDTGPIFKVRRCPCSSSSIPNGATILLHNRIKKVETAERTESSSIIFDASSNEEEDILMLLSDPNPLDQDFLSCLGHDVGGPSYGSSVERDMEKPYSLRANLDSQQQRSVDPSNMSSCSRHEIGEFYVEGRSSSSVWKMVSRTLIDACSEVYRKSGCLQFCCRHECASSCSDGETLKDVHARFCSASGPIEITRVIQNVTELETSLNSLTEWLEQDRFGFDTGFVQEIIETLPTSRSCSQYQFLINRSDFSLSCTVGCGLLLAVQKNEEGGDEQVPYGLYSAKNGSELQDLPEDPPLTDICPPSGRPLSSKLPGELVGDVFQIWEFLCRFHEILALKEPLSFEELEEELIDPWPCNLNHLKKIEKENQNFRVPISLGTENVNCSDSANQEQNPFRLIPVETSATREATQAKVASRTYGNCSGVALTKAHILLLKVLVGELRNKVAAFLDPNFDARDSKPRRGRKKDIENSSPVKETKNELPAISVNELTWPELARRYVLAVLSMNCRMEDVSARESLRVFRCLHGDGGILCGALSGIAGMEADALLLAETERQISNSKKQENVFLPADHKDSDAAGTCAPAPVVTASSDLPEWAQLLEPVRKLPTNVGTRIRKCVYNSLEKNPPEWAKEILEHSISKEVYKGNASGPTKKAVLSILAKLTSSSQPEKPNKARRDKEPLSLWDVVMKKCRVVLRSAISADESKKFCNLLGTTLLSSSDNNDKGILGSPAMVSRPIDFRTIDIRLAVGAYDGSHEAFLDDVQEVWRNLRTAYGDQPDLMQKLEKLSQDFDCLYEEEVLQLLQKCAEHFGPGRLDTAMTKELNDILLVGAEIPKAPWEDGVCKVCGIDKDDISVLLCDKCDSEYHRYCLNPPLARIPEGDWFCPSCVSDPHKVQSESQYNQGTTSYSTGHLGDESCASQEALHQLASSMEVKEYWEFNIEERVFLLKFLCDEMLNTALIREHLELCVDKSNSAQQKLYALTIDWRNLKSKEELLARSVREHTCKSSGSRDFVMEEGATKFFVSPLKRAAAPFEMDREENGQTDVNQNFGKLLRRMIEKHANGIDLMAAESETHNGNGHIQNKATVNGNIFSSINVSNTNEHNGQGIEAAREEVLNTEQNGTEQLNADALHGSHSILDFGRDRFAENAHFISESEASNLEANSIRNEISHLEDSIASLESQVMFTSLRRDFLGRDSLGRLYWVIGRPGKKPFLLVDGKMPLEMEKTGELGAATSDFNKGYGIWNLSPLVLYESDTEIQQLVSWLRDADPRERDLKECILQWQRLSFYHDNIYLKVDPKFKFSAGEKVASPRCLITKALAILESMYGPCLELESEIPKKRGKKAKANNEDRMYRCECLEPIWPSRHHCLSCHQTFFSVKDFEGHNDGRCASTIPAPDESKEGDDQVKGKGIKSDNIKGKDRFDDADAVETSMWGKFDISSKLVKAPNKICPFDLEEISTKFITNDSNKELVKEIGLLGSNGVPSLISSPPMFFDPPLLLTGNKKTDTCPSEELASSNDKFVPNEAAKVSHGVVGDKPRHDSESTKTCFEDGEGDHLLKEPSTDMAAGKHASKIQGSKVFQSCTIPEPSLRPLVGKVSHIIKRLKINLLDMEAALPEEAFRPSNSHIMRRCAWCAFVKSAESIFEMIQATILLEGMIKADFLKNGWWYWSSLTAAAKTCTVSSLALRIYALDDSIIYSKDKDPLVESFQPISKSSGKKRKDIADV